MGDMLNKNKSTLARAAATLHEVRVRFDAFDRGEIDEICALPFTSRDNPDTFDLFVACSGQHYEGVRYDQIVGEVEILPEDQQTTPTRCIEPPIVWPELGIDEIMEMG